MEVKEILQSHDPKLLRTLFSFTITDDDEKIRIKFNLWARYFQPIYFKSKDAPFHKNIDLNNIATYKGSISSFVDVAFRGGAKSARTKLFVAFCIANDSSHFRRYIKILSADLTNAKQIVTDVYNILIQVRHYKIHPEIFEKTDAKREETMASFTTATGVKMISDTVGTEQRGAIQEDARPDWIWFEDFESRKTLRSAKVSKSIWDNMEEARTGLAQGGSCIYTCNYISEMGNVHTLVTRSSTKKTVMITPILDSEGKPTWSRYSLEEIEQMKRDDEDFEGERMCKPSASKDVLFDRDSLEKQEKRLPIRSLGGLKMFYEYDPSHRYAFAHDIAGGVGLDSSTSVCIDFSTIPCRVVATFANNLIKPETFGDEIVRQSNIYGSCLLAPEENNHGHTTIFRAKQLGGNLWEREKGKYGWQTNAITKPKMLFAGAKAIADGFVALNDPDLIAEAMSYTRNDLIENEKDPRLTTRHFDLLTAFCIAWQMKDYAEIKRDPLSDFVEEEVTTLYSDIGI